VYICINFTRLGVRARKVKWERFKCQNGEDGKIGKREIGAFNGEDILDRKSRRGRETVRFF
jgi:hypothetical protein